MNPATDVGKRDLPAALKARFTEIFVDEITAKEDLSAIVFQVSGPGPKSWAQLQSTVLLPSSCSISWTMYEHWKISASRRKTPASRRKTLLHAVSLYCWHTVHLSLLLYSDTVTVGLSVAAALGGHCGKPPGG